MRVGATSIEYTFESSKEDDTYQSNSPSKLEVHENEQNKDLRCTLPSTVTELITNPESSMQLHKVDFLSEKKHHNQFGTHERSKALKNCEAWV
ncbi:hypothetical protein Lal_00013509 [Lupinus albus]|nr:hypothetical protein Lal_00013509 [Lupinus albus]